MAFWADGITKAWHLEKRKVHVASLTNTTYIIMSSLPVSGKRWVWIMEHKYLTKMWLLVGPPRFHVFALIPFVSRVGEGRVQAGLRPGQRRLREAGSAASTLRSTEHVLEGAESCPHHRPYRFSFSSNTTTSSVPRMLCFCVWPLNCSTFLLEFWTMKVAFLSFLIIIFFLIC